MERNEKLAIIRTHQIKFDVNEQAGRDLFKTFMMEGNNNLCKFPIIFRFFNS
jgi:hypothetical protein